MLLQPKPPQPRKLEGWAAKVQPSYGIQYVDLNPFYPPKSKAPISTEIDADARPGWRQPDPPAVNREVLADGSRRQRCGHLRDGTHDRRDERVRIGSRPRTVIAYVWIRKISNSLSDSGDHPLSGRTVRSKHDLWRAPEPSAIRNEAVYPNRFTPSGVVEPTVCGGTLFLHNDPAVRGDNSTPPHRTGGKDADDRTKVRSHGRQQSGARPICRLPVRDPVIHQIENRRESDRNQKENNETECQNVNQLSFPSQAQPLQS